MYNEKAIKKAKQKIGSYFFDLVSGKVEELWVREIHRKYNVSPAVIEKNLWFSFFKFEWNKKKVFLNEKRTKETEIFLNQVSKIILQNEDKKLSEILFYTINELKW